MKIFFILLTAFFFLFLPSMAHACSCIEQDPPFAFNEADAVFIGKMLGGTEKFSVKGWDGKVHQREAGSVKFSVEERFKGALLNEVIIEIDRLKGTSCGDYGLAKDETYLVYAYQSKKNSRILWSGVCTRTGSIKSKYVEEDLKFLRTLPPSGSGGNLMGRIWIDVKKISGGSAESLPDISIEITSEENKVSVVKSNKNGEFELKNIKAGKYRVKPLLPEIYLVENEEQEVVVADRGTAGIGFEAYYSSEVTGQIVDKNGVGFNSVFLHLLSTDKSKNQREVYGHSDGEEGKFTVQGIPSGEYILFLQLQHNDSEKNRNYYYPGTYNRKDAKVIKIGEKESIGELKFSLPNEFQVRTIEGQVFWEDGKPANDVEVLLLCPESTTKDGFTIEFSPTQTTTDKAGKFKIEGLTSEVYWLEVRAIKDDREFRSPPKKIILTENVDNIKLVLSENSLTGCK